MLFVCDADVFGSCRAEPSSLAKGTVSRSCGCRERAACPGVEVLGRFVTGAKGMVSSRRCFIPCCSIQQDKRWLICRQACSKHALCEVQPVELFESRLGAGDAKHSIKVDPWNSIMMLLKEPNQG